MATGISHTIARQTDDGLLLKPGFPSKCAVGGFRDQLLPKDRKVRAIVVEKERGQLPDRVSLGQFLKIRVGDCLAVLIARDAVDIVLKPGESLGRICCVLTGRQVLIDRLQAGLSMVSRNQQFVRTPVGPRNHRPLLRVNLGTLLIRPLEQRTILVYIHNA
jgi:hypothetical protein